MPGQAQLAIPLHRGWEALDVDPQQHARLPRHGGRRHAPRMRQRIPLAGLHDVPGRVGLGGISARTGHARIGVGAEAGGTRAKARQAGRQAIERGVIIFGIVQAAALARAASGAGIGVQMGIYTEGVE